MDDGRSAIALAVLAVAGVSAPVFALTMSILAFVVAVHALRQVNCVVKQLEDKANEQRAEISELAADPSEGGRTGGG